MQVSHSDLSLLITHTSGQLPQELLSDLTVIRDCESASKYFLAKVLKIAVKLAEAVRAEQTKRKTCKDEEPQTMEEVGLPQGKSQNQPPISEEDVKIVNEKDRVAVKAGRNLRSHVNFRSILGESSKSMSSDVEDSMPRPLSKTSNKKQLSRPMIKNQQRNQSMNQRQGQRRKLYCYIFNLIRVLHRERNHKWLEKQLTQLIPKNYFNPQRLRRLYQDEQFRNGLLGISIAEDLKKIEESLDIDKLISDKQFTSFKRTDISTIIRNLRDAVEISHKHQAKKGTSRKQK